MTFIRIIKLSDKLDFIKLGSFWIAKVLGSFIYKLDLLECIKILYIWYISVLEPAHKNIPLIMDILDIDPESQDKV